MLLDFHITTGKHSAMKAKTEVLTVGSIIRLMKMINFNLLERIWLPRLSSAETFMTASQYLMINVNQQDLVHGKLSKMSGKPRRNDGDVTILFSRFVLINYNSSSKRDILRFCCGAIGAPASGGSESSASGGSDSPAIGVNDACDAIGCWTGCTLFELFDREFCHSGSSLSFFLVKIDTK